MAEKGRPAQIAVQAFQVKVPFPGALEVGNAGRTLVLTGGDRSQGIKGFRNRRAKLTNERGGLRALFRCNGPRHVVRMLILLRTLRCSIFRSAARGVTKLLAKLL